MGGVGVLIICVSRLLEDSMKLFIVGERKQRIMGFLAKKAEGIFLI